MRKTLAQLGAFLFRPQFSIVDAAVLLAVAWFVTYTGSWFAWCIFLIWRAFVGEIETRVALRRSRRFRRP